MICDSTAQELAGVLAEYIALRKDYHEERYLGSKPRVKKGGLVGGINDRLLEVLKKLSPNKKAIRFLEIRRRTHGQTRLDFQKQKYESLIKHLGRRYTNNEIVEISLEYKDFLKILDREYDAVNWLNKWVSKIQNLNLSTYSIKFSRSSIECSDFYNVKCWEKRSFLATNSAKQSELDIISYNGFPLPIAQLLKLSRNGISIMDCLINNDQAIFRKITDDHELIQKWIKNLKPSLLPQINTNSQIEASIDHS